MNSLSFTADELLSGLHNLNIVNGDVVLIHSDLFRFGTIQGIEINQQCEKILKILEKLVGEKGTLVVPSFNFDFCKGIEFDYFNTPSKKNGCFF